MRVFCTFSENELPKLCYRLEEAQALALAGPLVESQSLALAGPLAGPLVALVSRGLLRLAGITSIA